MNNALLSQQKLIIVHNTTTQMGLIQNEVFQLRGSENSTETWMSGLPMRF